MFLPSEISVGSTPERFARSSPRFYDWLLSHRVFGPLVYEWRERRTIPRKIKGIAITLIVLTFGLSIGFVIPVLSGKLVHSATALLRDSGAHLALHTGGRRPRPR